MNLHLTTTGGSYTIAPPLVAQLPIKLTPLNFPSWRCQFQSMLIGYDLLGYINDSIQCLTTLVLKPGSTTTPPEMISNLAYVHWMWQDQLLLHGIISSTSEIVVPFITSSQSSKQAWDKIQSMYANKLRSRMMNLKDKLTKLRGTKNISKYFQSLRSIADELALINSPVNEDDLVFLHSMELALSTKKSQLP